MIKQNFNHNRLLFVALLAVCLICFYGFHTANEKSASRTNKDLVLFETPKNNAVQENLNIAYASSTSTILDDANWITYGRELPEKDSLSYLEQPAPIFRKELNLKVKFPKQSYT